MKHTEWLKAKLDKPNRTSFKGMRPTAIKVLKSKLAKKPTSLFKGKPLNVSAGAQARYDTRLQKLIDEMILHVRDEVSNLASSPAYIAHKQATGMDEGIGSQARILTNAFQKKFDALFGGLALEIANEMVSQVNSNSAQQSTLSLRDIADAALTLDIKKLDAPTQEILKAAVAQSTAFIKSIPEEYINKVQAAVLNSVTTGKGLADLQPYLEKQGNKTKNWAHLTAMDQTRKTFNGLNAGRMRKAGVSKGEWVHSGGSLHPRELHEDYDGKSFVLSQGAPVGDDGGNYVMPGEEPNCRCTFTPIIDMTGHNSEGSEDDDDE